jgi:hypothetical protein
MSNVSEFLFCSVSFNMYEFPETLLSFTDTILLSTWGKKIECLNGVWEYCVTANVDSATFTDMLVTTDPFLLEEPFLSDRHKSTRSFLGHLTLLTGNSLSTFQSAQWFRPQKDTVFFYVRWWLRNWAGGRGFDSRWGPSGRNMALESTQPLNRNEYQEYLFGG